MARARSRWITLFVIVWIVLFHYESTRYFFLNRLFGRELPKVPLLFPPAGWIMFYRVDDGAGHVAFYGRNENGWIRVDPHDVFRVRYIGFDNIHRGVAGVVLSPQYRQAFCRFVRRRFPEFDAFAVHYVVYPSLVEGKYRYAREMFVYGCSFSRTDADKRMTNRDSDGRP